MAKIRLRYKETVERSFFFANAIRAIVEKKYPESKALQPGDTIPGTEQSLSEKVDIEQLCIDNDGSFRLFLSYLIVSTTSESAINRIANRTVDLAKQLQSNLKEVVIAISSECPRASLDKIADLRNYLGQRDIYFEFWEAKDVRSQIQQYLNIRCPAFETEHLQRLNRKINTSWSWKIDLESQTNQQEDENSKPMGRLFVCHASEDKPFVEKLVSVLDKHADHVWFDKREILVGDLISEKINHGLSQSDSLIAVLSKSSISKPWVTRELSYAINQSIKEKSYLIIPVLIEACEIPPLIADILYADFTSNFSFGVNQVVASLQRMNSRQNQKAF